MVTGKADETTSVNGRGLEVREELLVVVVQVGAAVEKRGAMLCLLTAPTPV